MPHIHEKIDFTASVFIVNKNRVFLRLHDKYKDWLGVGGHIELNEDPEEAVIREAKEEAGLDIELAYHPITHSYANGMYKEVIPPRAMNRHRINETHEHVDMVYFARSQSNEIKPSGNDASHEWRWLTKEELEKNELGIAEDVKHYALAALEELGT